MIGDQSRLDTSRSLSNYKTHRGVILHVNDFESMVEIVVSLTVQKTAPKQTERIGHCSCGVLLLVQFELCDELSRSMSTERTLLPHFTCPRKGCRIMIQPKPYPNVTILQSFAQNFVWRFEFHFLEDSSSRPDETCGFNSRTVRFIPPELIPSRPSFLPSSRD